MKRQQWIFLLLTLVMFAGAAVVLTRLQSHRTLGQPGIKAEAIPGQVMMKISLPENVLDFTSTNVPESEVELGYFPKDTSYVRRFYQAPDGFGVSAIIILMGADRTSIHKPDYCLPGQGWSIDSKKGVNISIRGDHPYELPVMKWTIHNTIQMLNGQKQTVSGVFVFWFVADQEQTTDNYQRMWWLARDLIRTGVLQRWAYISYLSICAPGQEDATFERMEKLIAASVPEYQLPPVKH